MENKSSEVKSITELELLDCLAHLLTGADVCAAVALYDNQLLVSNNTGDGQHIQECMDILCDFVREKNIECYKKLLKFAINAADSAVERQAALMQPHKQEQMQEVELTKAQEAFCGNAVISAESLLKVLSLKEILNNKDVKKLFHKDAENTEKYKNIKTNSASIEQLLDVLKVVESEMPKSKVVESKMPKSHGFIAKAQRMIAFIEQAKQAKGTEDLVALCKNYNEDMCEVGLKSSNKDKKERLENMKQLMLSRAQNAVSGIVYALQYNECSDILSLLRKREFQFVSKEAEKILEEKPLKFVETKCSLHAEMNIIQHIYDTDQAFNDKVLKIGISKRCCASCSVAIELLDRTNIEITAKDGNFSTLNGANQISLITLMSNFLLN